MTTQLCPNCGVTVGTPYCPSCGQSQAPLNISLRQWILEFLDEQFGLNGKLPRTLRALLFKPGRLTREWLAGRRTSYTTPLRLYLSSAVLFFGLFALTSGSRDLAQGAAAGARASAPADSAASPTRFGAWLERLETDEAYSEALAASVLENFPRAMLVVLPVIALVLTGLHRSAGYYFMGHLVFALHVQALFFFVATLLIPVMNATGAWKPVATVVLAALGMLMYLYLFLALRAVYKTSWLRTTINFIAVVLVDMIVRTGLAVVLATAFA